MKGVILCGGQGTRLRPATEVMNKHILPIVATPMVLHPLYTLKHLGVDDILIVTGGNHVGMFAELLGDGSKYGVNLTYKVQTKAGGIAEALLLAEDFCHAKSYDAEDLWVILGDNVFGKGGFPESAKMVSSREYFVTLSEVDDNRRFGVPTFAEDGKTIINVTEKPENPTNKFAITGLYHYPPEVFDVIKEQNPSARGELEISDTNYWAARNGELKYQVIKSFWSDCGTPESLARTTRWFLDNPDDSFV